MAEIEKGTVITVRHGDDPPDDRVHRYLRKAGYRAKTVRAFAGEALPGIDGSIAGVVVFGGGFDAFDHYSHPFLAAEARLIEGCLTRNLPLVGICQGGQQIAHVLGARVGPSLRELTEFGYYPIDPVPGAEDFLAHRLVVAQSHFHEFALPKGARHLATSAACEVQAFAFGRAIAMQFHPEVTPTGFKRWQAAPWARYGAPGAQNRDEQNRMMRMHDRRQGEWFRKLLAAMWPSVR